MVELLILLGNIGGMCI